MFLEILRYAEFHELNLLINQIERLRLLRTVRYRYTKCDVVVFWKRHFLSSDLHLCEMVIYWWLSHLWHFLWHFHWRQPLFHPIGCICNPNRLYYCLLWCLYNHQSIKKHKLKLPNFTFGRISFSWSIGICLSSDTEWQLINKLTTLVSIPARNWSKLYGNCVAIQKKISCRKSLD